MSKSKGQFEELALLAAALCDGRITPQEAARIEELAASRDARRLLCEYIQLHGELHWEHAASAGRTTLPKLDDLLASLDSGPESMPQPDSASETPTLPPPRAPGRFLGWLSKASPASLMVATTAGTCLLTVLVLWTVAVYRDGPSNACVAKLTRVFEAEWSDPAVLSPGDELAAGQKLDLAGGLAEVVYASGARVLLQGPASFELSSSGSGFLRLGSLTAYVPPGVSGFKISTPNATVVDKGTVFGVAVQGNGPSEVHVFVGTVTVQPGSSAKQDAWRDVVAGEAVSVSVSAGGATPKIKSIPAGSRGFVRSLPETGSVAGLRVLVASHPNLIHHYTFEGANAEEKRRDKCGILDLVEVAMCNAGDGSPDYSTQGVDDSTNAVRPYRAVEPGNANGVGFVSQLAFVPPDEMTIELLIQFEGEPADDAIWAALAMRKSRQQCSFFVAAHQGGRLFHLMSDGTLGWIDAQETLLPGNWYYFAATFLAGSQRTKLSCYLADLSQKEPVLQTIVDNEEVIGVPASGNLAVGSGYQDDLTHAYPWDGAIDEVAVYNTLLDRKTLKEHVRAIVKIADR